MTMGATTSAGTTSGRPHIADYEAAVRQAGQNLLPGHTDYPAALNSELRHLAVETPGKLVRPCLSVGVASILSAPTQCVYAYAWACELLHVSSLVLDDLPAMDAATMRRGEPCIHLRRDEAFALFTALHGHNTALSLIHTYATTAEIGMAFYQATFDALGTSGLIGGQYLDIDLRRGQSDINYHEAYRMKQGFRSVWTMCNHFKTASLFRLALQAVTIPLELPPEEADCLMRVGDLLGLSFQLRDDMADDAEDTNAGGVIKKLMTPAQCEAQLNDLRDEYWAELNAVFGAKGNDLACLMDSVIGRAGT